MNLMKRPKMTGDTFFLPDPAGAVYFRNNRGSFRMEGHRIDSWIEKLVPVFNGNHTLEELTSALPDAHRKRVYEIADDLLQKGFARDVSLDLPHTLPDGIRDKYVSQIDFLDSFGGSGAHRFENFRKSKVLAAGSGPIFLSLVSALLDAGLADFRLLITGGDSTDRHRLAALASYARLTDPEVSLAEVEPPALHEPASWKEAVGQFDWIVYVSSENRLEELRAVHAACRDLKKKLIPAIVLGQTGIAGPLVSPESEGCWESAWRRLHRAAVPDDPGLYAESSTVDSLLANTAVFELFKAASGLEASGLSDQIYVLNCETLEGSRHPFLPHPFETTQPDTPWEEHLREIRTEPDSAGRDSPSLFSFFSRLTSPVTGIFHVWDEGDYKQLPLSVCRVQAADPLSDGPAQLLQEIVCGGFTHEEARREAGLAGIECYAERLFQSNSGGCGIGTGASAAEAVCRGLHRYLSAQVERRDVSCYGSSATEAANLLPEEWADVRISFYLTSLNTIRGETAIFTGEEAEGFPVIVVNSGGFRYHGVGLNRIMALRNALSQALLDAQCGSSRLESRIVRPAMEEGSFEEWLASARSALQRRGKRLAIRKAGAEPFIEERLAGVFAVTVREEGMP